MADVRPASDSDIPDLCDLYLQFHEFHVDRIPERLLSLRSRWDQQGAELAERLREILRDRDSAVLVAVVDEEIAAFSEIYLREEVSKARRDCCYCHLQSMFVSARHRGRGVGRLLLEASESWARSRGATEMRLDVWEFADGPSRFYERCGYHPYRRSYARPLEHATR